MRHERPVGRLRALGALVVLLAVVVGAPAAILAVFGWPLTRGVLDVRRWPDALTTTELSDDAIVRVFVTLALVVLVYLLGCALSEVAALVRRTERRARSHNPLSHWVRHLVAVSAVLLSTARPVASLPSAGPAAPPAPATAVLRSAGAATGGLRALPDPQQGLAVVGDRVVDARDVRAGTVVVEAGRRDTLYSLAVRHLGDGERRDELLALNRGRVMPDGTTFDGTVRPGYPILVPDAAGSSVSAPAPAPAAERTYTVAAGDSLWSIAERLWGDGAQHERLHRANLGREVAPGVAYLSTTTVIRPGWVLVVPEAEAPEGSAASDGAAVHVVRAGESVWSIATDALADGGGAASPADVAAYVERTVEANQDRFVRPGHPELIHPGQELVLPPPVADAGPTVGAPLAPPLPPPPAEAAAPGAGVPGPAEVSPTVGSAGESSPEDVAPADAAPPDGGPAEAAPVPSSPPIVLAPPTTLPAPASPAATSPVVPAPVTAIADDADDDRAGPSLPGLAGAAVLAAGALGVVLRLRHHRLNRRRPGTRIDEPGDAVALVERVLRAQADLDLARWAPLALRHLAPRLGHEWDGSFPLVAEVALRPGGMSVRWTAPRPTPVGAWRSAAGGAVWELDRAADGADAADLDVPDGVVPPCPALVTIGRVDGAPVLLDVEAAGLVSVRGDAERVAAFGRAAVLELAVTDFADLLDIRLVGLPGDGFEHLGRVHAVPALDQALAWARPLRTSTDELLEEEGSASLFELRARQGANAVTHEPLVLVVAGGLLDAGGTAELRRLCEPGRGVVAVVLGDVDAPVRVTLGDDGSAAVERPGGGAAVLEALAADRAPALPQATLDSVGALLAHAAEAPEHVLPTPLPVRRGEPFAEPASAVEVRLLGPVAVGPFGGEDLPDVPARTLELIVWLATHGPHQPGGRLRADLWAGRDGAARALNHHVAAARALLGSDAAGRVLLPAPTDDRYGLADGVVTDVERLERRLRWALTAADTAAVPVLREGLTLVRGRPFTVRSGYAWAFADQVVFRAEQLVVDAAHRLGSVALALDDPAGAVWATGVGLLGRPGDETLYQLRMRAFARMGNRSSVRQAMNQLCSELQDLAGVDEPSDETAELFEQLMGRERSA